MNWRRLCEIGQTLRGVETNASTISSGDVVLARRVDATTVAFAVEDRDALIARAPDLYFITERYAELPIVLAHLAALDDAEAHTRLGVRGELAATAPSQPRAPRLYYLGYTTESGRRERRTFKRLGRGTVERWLLAAWRAHLAEESWGGRVPHDATHLIEGELMRADEEGITCPVDDGAALAALREALDCKPYLHTGGDDFEGRQWEFYLFDERYLREDDNAGYLPHPERGETEKNADDGYRDLLAKHGMHERS